MHISTNYSTIYGLISLILGKLVHLHSLYILLSFHENISNSLEVVNIFCVPTIGEQLAVHPAMHYQVGGSSNLPS